MREEMGLVVLLYLQYVHYDIILLDGPSCCLILLSHWIVRMRSAFNAAVVLQHLVISLRGAAVKVKTSVGPSASHASSLSCLRIDNKTD